jgi:hypothetical protein
MTTADTYRRLAAELKAKALNVPSDKAAAELDHLARCYIRLAKQADQNSRLDISAEFGPKDRQHEGQDA